MRGCGERFRVIPGVKVILRSRGIHGLKVTLGSRVVSGIEDSVGIKGWLRD